MRIPLVYLLVCTVMVCVPSARRPRRTVDLLLLETASCSHTSGYILSGESGSSGRRNKSLFDYLFGAAERRDDAHNYLCEVSCNIDRLVEVSSRRCIRESYSTLYRIVEFLCIFRPAALPLPIV